MKTITKEQEDFLYRFTRGTWELNTETGLVDILGDFNCSSMGLSDFMGIEFGNINGIFMCAFNRLVSLKGAPKEVGKSFYCDNNKLVSLEGAPRKVVGNFHCYNNQLVSLEGAPIEMIGYFDCSRNKLTSLEGAPQKVGGTFSCANNQLVSLEGAPIEVMRNFYCENNKLVSLEGISNIILGNLYCDPVNIRNRPIYKFAGDIYFYINGDFTELKKYIKKFINNLAPEIYLKNMIRIS